MTSDRGAVAAVAGVLIGAVAGIGAGYAVGVLTEAKPVSVETGPLEAVSPSVPFTPYSEDVPYPAWQPDLSYRRSQLGPRGFAWSYDVPRGWSRSNRAASEVSWGVPGHPLGSYGMRVELVGGEHMAPSSLVDSKLRVLRSIYSEVRVLDGTNSSTLAVSYRSNEENWLRFNTFRWFVAPGSETAAVELSVNGRAADQAGMLDLLEHVSATLEPTP